MCYCRAVAIGLTALSGVSGPGECFPGVRCRGTRLLLDVSSMPVGRVTVDRPNGMMTGPLPMSIRELGAVRLMIARRNRSWNGHQSPLLLPLPHVMQVRRTGHRQRRLRWTMARRVKPASTRARACSLQRRNHCVCQQLALEVSRLQFVKITPKSDIYRSFVILLQLFCYFSAARGRSSRAPFSTQARARTVLAVAHLQVGCHSMLVCRWFGDLWRPMHWCSVSQLFSHL